jgi:hypothetical protein
MSFVISLHHTPTANTHTHTQAYLDFLVGAHAAPPALHDELFLLLLTALLAECAHDGNHNDKAKGQDRTQTKINRTGTTAATAGAAFKGQEGQEGEGGMTELGRLYQERLREFLRTSTMVGGLVIVLFCFVLFCFVLWAGV